MKVGFDGIGQELVTFLAEEGLTEGAACMVTGNDTVGPCGAQARFCGVAGHVGGGLATVQVRGFVKLPYSGTAPQVGFAALVADGTGGVTAGGDTTYLVVQVDEAAKTVGLVL